MNICNCHRKYSARVNFKMATETSNVYQFKVTLKGIKPPIWRRIQVPGNYNFHQFHVAIQHAMGWMSAECNYHLHDFKMVNPRTSRNETIGIPDNSFEVGSFFHLPVVEEKGAKIAQYFSLSNKKANYEYDFGDGWEHNILLERILPAEAGKKYPQCLAGKRACPPEDCGGRHGYQELLEIIANPNHAEYRERMKWLAMIGNAGEDFDPEEFNPR